MKKPFHWVGLNEVDLATLVAICDSVAWKRRASTKLQQESLAMSIKLYNALKTLFPPKKKPVRKRKS